jgi:PD-(D/E)XK nuclease superfamily
MDDIEDIAKDIVDAAYKVHKEFGPGLLETAYQQCHVYELRKRGRQVLTELKLPIHMAQLITYLKLKDCKLGFLINWNVKLIKNGITRVANGMVEPSLPAKFIKKP